MKEFVLGYGGVLFSNGLLCKESEIRAKHLRDRFGGGYEVNTEQIECDDREVVYIGLYRSQWGHFLLEGLSRLWVLQEINITDAYFVFTSNEGFPQNNALRLFSILGIKREQLILVSKPTRFKKIIVPESSYVPGHYWTREYKNIFDTILEKNVYNGDTYNKIYLSRTRLRKDHLEIGEKLFQDFFESRGYKIIYPEMLLIDEQIGILCKAKSIASLNGTIAHNIVWCKNIKEQIILNKNKGINKHQILISEMRGIVPKEIDVFDRSLKSEDERISVAIEVNDNFKRFCEDNLGIIAQELNENSNSIVDRQIVRILSVIEGKRAYKIIRRAQKKVKRVIVKSKIWTHW